MKHREHAETEDVKGGAISPAVGVIILLRNAADDLVDRRRPITADGCRRYLEDVHAIHSRNVQLKAQSISNLGTTSRFSFFFFLNFHQTDEANESKDKTERSQLRRALRRCNKC